jgi:hypothetical protein
MAKRSPRTVLTVIGLVLIAAATGAVYALSILLSDQVTYRRGDIAYRLTVTSDTIQSFPTFAKDERLIDYTYSARDGTAPEHIELSYASTIHPDELADAHHAHCVRQGFETIDINDRQLASVVRCRAGDYLITAAAQPRNDGETQVRVSFVGR